MKCSKSICCLVAATGTAGIVGADTALPFSGSVRHATIMAATGEVIVHGEGAPRSGPEVVWDNTTFAGQFTDSGSLQFVDWGDIGSGHIINGFSFGYFTRSTIDAISVELTFYGTENGFGDTSDTLRKFVFSGLFGDILGTGTAWTFDVDLTGTGDEFAITGPDLDADSLIDFGFGYRILNPGNNTTGPLIASGGVGNEDAFDVYAGGAQNAGGTFTGTSFFGGDPFAGFYMKLEAVPAPGAAALLGLGGLIAARRRR